MRWTHDSGAADNGLVVSTGKGDVFVQPGSDGILRAISVLAGTEVWRWETGQNGALTEPVQLGTIFW